MRVLNHNSKEVLRLPITVKKKKSLHCFPRKCMYLPEPLKIIKIHFHAHRNKFATKDTHFICNDLFLPLSSKLQLPSHVRPPLLPDLRVFPLLVWVTMCSAPRLPCNQ